MFHLSPLSLAVAHVTIWHVCYHVIKTEIIVYLVYNRWGLVDKQMNINLQKCDYTTVTIQP